MVPLNQLEHRPCMTEYQIETPMGDDSPLCACDTFAIGRCTDCRTWICGHHSALWVEDERRYCSRCLVPRQAEAARAAAERAAAHEAADSRAKAAAQDRSQERLRAALTSVGSVVRKGEPPDVLRHHEHRNPSVKRTFPTICVAGHPSCTLVAGGGRKDAEATYEARGWVLFRSRRIDQPTTATVFLLTDGTLVREEGGFLRTDYTGSDRPRLAALTDSHSIFRHLPDPRTGGFGTPSIDSLCEMLESLTDHHGGLTSR